MRVSDWRVIDLIADMLPIWFNFSVLQHCFIAISDAHKITLLWHMWWSKLVEANAGDLIPVTLLANIIHYFNNCVAIYTLTSQLFKN